MKLLRLHLQGFKSFKDKTTIHFDEGITGIVGPNGCGKSNIVDALFWVMGEQSAKHLRGTKMKDLIFAGSSKYAPGSFAEVTLVLENTKNKHIHIGSQVSSPNEIALTRKLYRNGETEYRINNTPARLKDIQEVFMDTGAGAKSYSIIAQGEINRLVQAKPVERRTMIEEVAGITKFKMRKRDSVKKIEQTQANLNRLNDLQSEIYKNLKALERQAEKAEKARTLKARIERHELIVKSHKEFDYLTTYVNAHENLEANNLIIDESKIKRNQIEETLEDERALKDELRERIDVLQSEYNDLSRELAAGQERLKHFAKSAYEKKEQIESKSRDIEEIEKDKEQRSVRLEELKSSLEELQSTNYEEMDFSSLEEAVEFLQSQLEDKKQEYTDLKAQKEEVQDQAREADQVSFRNSSKLEEYAAILEDTTAEIEEIEKSTANFNDEILNQREKVKTLGEELESRENAFEEIRASYDDKKKLSREKDNELRELSREVIKLDSRLQSLREVNAAGAGVREGATDFMKESETADFNIIGNLIESESEYATVLEVLFKDHFNALVAADAQYGTLFDWYMNQKDKSFDLIVPEKSGDRFGPDTLERLSVKGCQNAVAVADIIKVNEEKYKETLSELFKGFYIADELTPELGLKIVSDLKVKGVISRDGMVFVTNNNGSAQVSTRTAESTGMGVVQRNNLINELTEQFEEKSQLLEKLEDEVATLNSEVEQMRSELDAKTKELNESNTEYIALKSSLESKEGNYSSTSSRLDILQKRKSETSVARLELLEKEEEILNQKQDSEERLANITEMFENIEEELENLKMDYESKRSELLELQAKASSYQSQVNGLESQIEDINAQLLRFDEKIALNNETIERLENEIEEASLELDSLEEKNAQQQEELNDKDAHLTDGKEEFATLLSGMQAREDEIKQINNEINRREKMNVELELKIEKSIEEEDLLVRDIFERYRVDLRETLQAYLQYTDEQLEGLKNIDEVFTQESEEGEVAIEKKEYEFDKKFPAVLRESQEKFKRYKSEFNRLGEINWQAIEDYDRQKLRYDFLRKQEEELKASLVDLETAIGHIDEKSRIRFKEAFDEVNLRFTKVFPIIFGGGEARLEIVGHVDDPECGIEIIAKPPGKKMQSINLMSGGEKAMTAVSLIFSIFLVKPSPFCLLDEVDAPLDDANVGRFNELLREMSAESQFILITHNKKTMELNDTLYGVTMQEPGVSKAVSVQLQ